MSLMTGRIQLLHTIAPIEKIAQYFIRRQAIFSETWSKMETLNSNSLIIPFNFKANIALVLSRAGLQYVDECINMQAWMFCKML